MTIPPHKSGGHREAPPLPADQHLSGSHHHCPENRDPNGKTIMGKPVHPHPQSSHQLQKHHHQQQHQHPPPQLYQYAHNNLQQYVPAPLHRSPTPEVPLSRTLLITKACPKAMRHLHQDGEWGIEHFAVHKKIGSGKLSDVYHGSCRRTGVAVAIKIYHRALMQELNQIQLEREISIHSRLDHENIIKLYIVFEDANASYLIQEYAPKGDLFREQRRVNGRVYSERECVRLYLYPCLKALAYIHSLGIVHRDIKPENLLLAADGTLKMADFGLAIDALEERPQTRLGTLFYMSPEVLMCPDRRALHSTAPPVMVYNDKVDAWAVGILAYELMIGRSPFEMSTRDQTCARIVCGPLRLPSSMSRAATEFFNCTLHKSPEYRMSCNQILKHSWIMEYCDPRSKHQPHGAFAPKQSVPPALPPQEPCSSPVPQPPSGDPPQSPQTAKHQIQKLPFLNPPRSASKTIFKSKSFKAGNAKDSSEKPHVSGKASGGRKTQDKQGRAPKKAKQQQQQQVTTASSVSCNNSPRVTNGSRNSTAGDPEKITTCEAHTPVAPDVADSADYVGNATRTPRTRTPSPRSVLNLGIPSTPNTPHHTDDTHLPDINSHRSSNGQSQGPTGSPQNRSSSPKEDRGSHRASEGSEGHVEAPDTTQRLFRSPVEERNTNPLSSSLSLSDV